MDAMFGDTPEEPEPFETMMDVEGEETDEGVPIDPDELPDPEPIPDALIAPAEEDEAETEPRGRMARVLTLVAVVVVIFGALGAGLFFARDTIVSALPAGRRHLRHDQTFRGGAGRGTGDRPASNRPVKRIRASISW